MKHRLRNSVRHAALAVVYLAFACNALIPIGFMPAAFADGAPLMLCSSGLPAGFLAEHGAHSDHENDHDEIPWEHCPFGALSGAAALTGLHEFHVPYLRHEFSSTPGIGFSVAIGSVGYHPRAPPLSIR